MLSFLSVGQQINVSIVVRIRNFRVSNRTVLLFALNQSFLSFLNQQLNFQSFLFFSEANCCFFLASFFKLLFGETFSWTMTEVWLLLVSLRKALFVEMSTK